MRVMMEISGDEMLDDDSWCIEVGPWDKGGVRICADHEHHISGWGDRRYKHELLLDAEEARLLLRKLQETIANVERP